jgi:hypothetical protein
MREESRAGATRCRCFAFLALTPCATLRYAGSEKNQVQVAGCKGCIASLLRPYDMDKANGSIQKDSEEEPTGAVRHLGVHFDCSHGDRGQQGEVMIGASLWAAYASFLP